MKRTATILQRLINVLCEGYRVNSLFVIFMILCLGACTPKHSSYSEFKEILQEGWAKSVGCEFVPEYKDTASHYNVDVALCVSHKYAYRNASVVVDFLKQDSLVERCIVDYELTDANGNWSASGFGVMYQVAKRVKDNLPSSSFDKIQVWQGLDCDTLPFVEKVGVLLEANE